jgi:hypothetical protein
MRIPSTFTRVLAGALLAAICAASPAAIAGVTVNFVKPDQYADMPFTPAEKERVLKVLEEHFVKLGKKLPDDQDLKIDVLDIDLAGRLKLSGNGAMDLRVLGGGADWPKMQVKFSLESKGQVLKSGEDRMADMNYLNRFNQYPSTETLRYEKLMIDEWFAKRFLPPKP